MAPPVSVYQGMYSPASVKWTSPWSFVVSLWGILYKLPSETDSLSEYRSIQVSCAKIHFLHNKDISYELESNGKHMKSISVCKLCILRSCFRERERDFAVVLQIRYFKQPMAPRLKLWGNYVLRELCPTSNVVLASWKRGMTCYMSEGWDTYHKTGN